ncbi:hypothetical protein ACS5NO_31635 [Larkinella sp. GY13]|uniref:hypothetical protein n=1 Tax=Larkinella sp. GY13 TaxID=3453720 RepID=UPI003EEFABB1
MDYRLIELECSRLRVYISGIKANKYSDKRLWAYQNKLIELLSKVSEEISSDTFSIYSNTELESINQILQFIKYSTEFLKDSTLNLIPFETIYCLECALKEWVKEDNFIIVTSLQYNEYFFNGYLSLYEAIYDLILSKYNIVFDYRLIQISIPKLEVNDYLSNVVLYHELGHFVDSKYSIIGRIINDEYMKLSDDDKKARFEEFNILYNHLSEYFCDIFAAQYTSETASYYLDYVAGKDIDSSTHPSTVKRIEVVKAFLSDATNNIKDQLNEATDKVLGKTLSVRFSNVSIDDFISLIPCEIKNDAELHYLFILGWDIWLNQRNNFDGFTLVRLYEIINNLIEKSISNYIIQSKWKILKNNVPT